ncbi:MAG: hypothetical protein R3C01_15270 [Planctomycetaceae bacterium]
MPMVREGDLPFEPMPNTTPTPPMPVEPMPEPIDPRKLPLPYITYREKLLELTTLRDWGTAVELIDEAQGDKELHSVAELVEWDRQEIQELLAFQAEMERTLSGLAPGTSIRLGTVRVDFLEYSNGIIKARAKSTDVTRPVSELKSDELLNLLGELMKPDDAPVARRMALLLMYAGAGQSDRVMGLLKKAGDEGDEVIERVAGREARLAELEIDRKNFDQGFARIEALSSQFPESQAAAKVASLRDQLFSATVWKRVGQRQWTEGPLGLYAAGTERADGALLMSPEMLGDFTLQMEYMTTDPVGQGGVYFKYTGSGRLDRNAIKIHLANDAGINPRPLSYCGSLFSIDAPKSNRALAQGNGTSAWISLKGDTASAYRSTGRSPRRKFRV